MILADSYDILLSVAGSDLDTLLCALHRLVAGGVLGFPIPAGPRRSRMLARSASLAARTASSSSLLAPLRRAGRAGRAISTTHLPRSSEKVVSPAPTLPVPVPVPVPLIVHTRRRERPVGTTEPSGHARRLHRR
jgi:hypothetical protein